MDRLLQEALSSIIRTGTLRVTPSSSCSFSLGDGTGKPLALRLTSRAAQLGILLDPELRFGEAYMDGTAIVEQGSIADVLGLVMAQSKPGRYGRWARSQWLAPYPSPTPSPPHTPRPRL